MPLEPKIPTRMGDGSLVEMTRSEIKADLEGGTQIAAKKARVAELTQDELDHLLDIYASAARFTAVDIGDEVVMSNDGTGTKHIGNRVQDLQCYETLLGVDMVELWQIDYSYKAIKTNVAHEGQSMKIAQTLLTNPVQYGAMPDLGRYSKPDGPIPNWSELLPHGQDRRGARRRRKRPPRCSSRTSTSSPTQWSRPAPTASTWTRPGRPATPTSSPPSGPAACCARSTRGWASRSAWPPSSCSACTASSSSTASAWPACGPRTSCAWCRQAGASIYGPAVNINTGKSTAWNIARAITFIKPAIEIAEIPVHVNVGMGVGGVPTCVYPPADATRRATKAFVEILKIDGY